MKYIQDTSITVVCFIFYINLIKIISFTGGRHDFTVVGFTNTCAIIASHQ